MKIRIGIVGYGNLGRGTELAIAQNSDMELAGVFTRRDPSSVKTLGGSDRVFSTAKALEMKDDIDVMVLCGGSAFDLVEQSPFFAAHFNIVDSFDTHARIPEHFKNVDAAAKKGEHTAVISAGWDPGLFSINRLYADAVLPKGKTYTFWGKGLSQGHSDAIRRIEGVLGAVQYTIPIESTVESVRSGNEPECTAREKHRRECFVAAAEGADRDKIRETIVTMPNYFADYDTTVEFVSLEDLERDHSGMPHGGFVVKGGTTGSKDENKHLYEFSLKLDSNPEFTSSILIAYARAAYRLSREGCYGCKTVLEIAPCYLSRQTADELRASLL